MLTAEFLRPRLTGDRFTSGAIPLEFLKDLTVLEEMLVEVAKWHFKREHPERVRSPRGFTRGVSLLLAGVEGGSAVPVINLETPPQETLFPTSQELYFTKARDAIVAAIQAGGNGQPVTDHLPGTALAYFDRFGRSLRDGEAIEFDFAGASSPARLTKETRRVLLRAATELKEVTEEAVVRGRVPEADQDDMTFELQLVDGRKIIAPLIPPHLATIVDAFSAYREGARVLVQGIAKYSRTGSLRGFESVEHVTPIDLLDVPARLEELAALSDGWLEGAGSAPDAAGLRWLSAAFDLHYPEGAPLPHVYPSPDGGIQAEWSVGPHEVSLLIDLSSGLAGWHHLDTDRGTEEEKDFDLRQPASWAQLADAVTRLSQAT